jgi:hypothetical protein
MILSKKVSELSKNRSGVLLRFVIFLASRRHLPNRNFIGEKNSKSSNIIRQKKI